MATALTGLIVIQFYWLQNAITIKEEQFRESVTMSLKSVVYKVEKLEAANYLKQHQLANNLFGGYSPMYYDGAVDEDSCWFSNPVKKGDINEKRQYVTSTGKVITRTRQDVIDECRKSKSSHSPKAVVDDKNVIDHFFRKSGMVTDIIGDLLNMRGLKVEDRIDPEVIKILLEEELTRAGIVTDFKYGILALDKGTLLKEMKVSEEDLFNSPYKIKLFPGEFSSSPKFLSVFFPREKHFLLRSLSGVMFISVLFISAIIFAFWYSLNVIMKQKKLAIVKNDFINNMTHELKTPISTISLACEVLKDKDITKTEERTNHYVDVIKEENKRLGVLVENVLQSAVWDRSDFKLKKVTVDTHQIIEEVVERFHVQVDSRNGELLTDLRASDSFIDVDKVHFTNVLYNLIDNAIKYCKENPKIEIATKNVNGGISISISDNGIGISKEHQSKIFDKLYRVPTGNVHDVKGFGLGLNYVMAIVDKHHGVVGVKSELNQGSTFDLWFPKNIENDGR